MFAMYFATVVCPTSMPSLSKFAVDARCFPKRVGNVYLANEVANLGWSTRPPAPLVAISSANRPGIRHDANRARFPV